MNPALISLIEMLERRTGMTRESIGGERAIETAMRQCARAAGFPETEAWADAATHSPELWEKFVQAVVVSETFLFRYPESFDALARWVQTRSRPHWRILCLPCSTGEEAYSISLTLREAGLTPDQFSVQALDIDARAVEMARSGHYSRASSLRGVSAAPLRRHGVETFRDGLRMKPEIASPITFEVRNFWDMAAPPAAFDILFCRNLLIYFSEENQRLALEKLALLLEPDGLLFLGPAEVPVAGKFGWRSANFPMSFACHRATDSPQTPVSPPPIRIPIKRITRSARQPVKTPPRNGSHNAGVLFLKGILSARSGEKERAEKYSRRVLYLNPDHTEAMLHLASLLELQDRHAASRKLRARAKRVSVR